MHYVDANWELRKSLLSLVWDATGCAKCRCTEEPVLIDFCELVGEHTGVNFASAVWESLEVYGLVGRVFIHVLNWHPVVLTSPFIVGVGYQLRSCY